VTPAFFLIIVLLLPGTTPKAEDAQLEVTTTLVRECPNQEVFKAQLDQDVKDGKLIRFDVSCIHTFVPRET
jgi:hypothetical protein